VLGRDGPDGGWRRIAAGRHGRWLVPAGGAVTFAIVARFTFIL
jgi:hypothetical protein